MSAGVERARVVVGAIQPRLVQAGPSDAPEAVVFVHGNPGSADDWEALVAAAGASGRRAVALDLPDFGETIAPPGFEHTPHGYAAFLGQALDALGVERVHLVLHDFGGAFGLLWAAEHVESVASLTLIGTGLMPGYRWHSLARVWRTPLLGELFQAMTTRAVLRIALNRAEPRGLPREFVDRVYDQYDRRTRRAVLKLYRATPDLGDMGEQFLAQVASVDIPALVIWGEHDAYLPASYAYEQRRAFPSADVHVLPASGHWPYVDSADTVERLLVDFLARLPAARPA